MSKWNIDGQEVKFAYVGQNLTLAYLIKDGYVSYAWAARRIPVDAPNKKIGRQVAFGRLTEGKQGQVFRERLIKDQNEYDDQAVRRILKLNEFDALAKIGF